MWAEQKVGGAYLDKGEFTRTLVLIIDDQFAIEVDPPLTSKQVVNTRRHLLPLVMVVMSTHKVN